jgi:carnitine-CoA ligase
VGGGAIGAALLATPPGPGDGGHALDRCVFIPMSPVAQHQFEERFGVHVLAEGCGQTAVLPATMGGVTQGRDRPSADHAVPWLDVAVVDDADNVLPSGKSGKIVVRPREPNAIFAGYWRKEGATLETWRNLWHHTGDLGYFDAGMMYFVDRKKDALRRRGENVSSVELELAILRHPGIVQVMDELPVNAVGRVLKHKLRDHWNADGTVDFQALGLTVDKSARR